jgi:hypothetical protein
MAIQYNIVVDQGSTHQEIFNVNTLTTPTLPYDATTNPYIPLDFTGYTAHLQIRKTVDASSTVLDLTNSSGLSLGSNGQVTITITAAQSTAVQFPGDRAVYEYDLLLINGSLVTRAVEGTVTFKRAITR